MASSLMTAEAERMKSKSDWSMSDAPSWGSAFPGVPCGYCHRRRGDGRTEFVGCFLVWIKKLYFGAFQPSLNLLSAFLDFSVTH